MKPFDLPYNFDQDLITFYSIYFKNNKNQIHSIYLPPFYKDYQTAKYFTPNINNNNYLIRDSIPKDEEEYKKHIAYINKLLPNTIMLLLQQNNYTININLLKKYLNLDIKKFCVGNLEQAKQIKNICPAAEITGSITMRVMPEDLYNNIDIYNKYFDNFVLWFPYNRSLPLIKQLPRNFNYILLVNCSCSINCDGIGHWLVATEKEEIQRRNYCKAKNEDLQNKIIIPPQHLYLFENYISYYKLQGREFSTELIINDTIKYNNPQQIDFNKLTIYDYNK